MPLLSIDNREIEVPAGTKVIEAAERLGIMIPRFCYHPALGSVGACRVCAVAFKDGPVKGIQMSCMINAQDGMVVSTTDEEAVEFRRFVIELLMLHHPHDCPVCDEGGHCLLQDMTVSGGHGMRRYRGPKRTHRNQDLGPLVQHEMNRCIQCYRCSRYYQGFAGYRDLGVRGIGSRVYFGRSASGVLESPFAGNLIDICPTGVYTDKPSRYTGRRWDFQREPTICLHCGLGCNMVVSTRYRQVVRQEAKLNAEVNGHFICDRGRYGFAYANAAERPREALLSGDVRPSAEVISDARERVRRTEEHFGSEAVAVAVSWRSSLETMAMIDLVCRQRGWAGPAVAQTERQARNLSAVVECLKPELAVSLGAVSVADEVLVIGADPVNEAPMLALSIRQVLREGGRVTVVDPRRVRMPFEFDQWSVHPMKMEAAMQELVTAVQEGASSGKTAETVAAASDALPVAELAMRLAASRRAVIVCGTDIVTEREIRLARELAETLRRAETDAKLFYTLAGANAFAAALMDGEDRSLQRIVERIEQGRIRTLIVVEQDPWREFPDRNRLREALKRLEDLIVLGHLPSPLNAEADCFLPTRTIFESGGRWVNQEGRLQAARSAMAGGEPIAMTGNLDHPPRRFRPDIPGDEPQAAWRLMADLSRHSKNEEAPSLTEALRTFHPVVAAAVEQGTQQRLTLEGISTKQPENDPQAMPGPEGAVTALLVDTVFGTEPLGASSPALCAVEDEPAAFVHPDQAARLGVSAGQRVTIRTGSRGLDVALQTDERMADGVIVIPRHHRLNWQYLGGLRVQIGLGRIRASS